MTRIIPMLVKNTKIAMEIYADCAQFGGWSPLQRSFSPLRFAAAASAFGSGSQTQYALDCMALAVEAGFFTTRASLKSSVFAEEGDFAAFCSALAKYDWWLNERHFYAFSELLDCDESSLRTYSDLAKEFQEEYSKY